MGYIIVYRGITGQPALKEFNTLTELNNFVMQRAMEDGTYSIVQGKILKVGIPDELPKREMLRRDYGELNDNV